MKTVKLIALTAFTDEAGTSWNYGAEFEMAEGPELDALIAAGTVRKDTRQADADALAAAGAIIDEAIPPVAVEHDEEDEVPDEP